MRASRSSDSAFEHSPASSAFWTNLAASLYRPLRAKTVAVAKDCPALLLASRAMVASLESVFVFAPHIAGTPKFAHFKSRSVAVETDFVAIPVLASAAESPRLPLRTVSVSNEPMSFSVLRTLVNV